MISTFVFGNLNQENLDKTITAVKAIDSNVATYVVGATAEGIDYDKQISIDKFDSDQILNEMKNALGDILIINSDLAPNTDELLSFISTCDNTATINYLALSCDGEIIDMTDSLTEDLSSLVMTHNNYPIACLLIKGGLIKNLNDNYGENATDFISYLIIAMLAQGESIKRANIPEYSFDNKSILTVSNTIKAKMLRFIINTCNIEELFPNNAWDTWGQESAAAAYQTLAARFLTLDDTDSAMECLALSDKLEDSPRALALKGLIALKRGEDLAAVANMVSSLQQYEIRKHEKDEHYLSFIPNDLNKINNRLNLALDALNKKDNQKAAGHFAEAVFDFDSFYDEFGLNKKI